MSESKLRDISTDFAVKVIKLTETIKGHYSLVNQLERSATSIGANIREANYAHGKPDFIAKLQIALKECYETEYWLELFVKSDIVNRGGFISFHFPLQRKISRYPKGIISHPKDISLHNQPFLRYNCQYERRC